MSQLVKGFFTCVSHGRFRSDVYKRGCPVCLCKEMNNTPEVRKQLKSRKEYFRK